MKHAVILLATLAALAVGASLLRGDDQPPDKPTPIAAEDREAFKDLRIEAYKALAAIEAAEKQRLQAEADVEHAKQSLAAANDKLTQAVGRLRKQAGAGDEWCLSASLLWTAKPPNKACPSW